MKIILVDKSLPVADSLIKKLVSAKTGDIIPLSKEEFEAFQWNCATVEIQETIPEAYMLIIRRLLAIISSSTELCEHTLSEAELDVLNTARRLASL